MTNIFLTRFYIKNGHFCANWAFLRNNSKKLLLKIAPVHYLCTEFKLLT